MRTQIIAEAGVNHNGCLDLACELALAAKNAGADYVKFQTFKAENIVTRYAEKAEYQKVEDKDGSQFELIKHLELGYSDFEKLIQYCKDIGIQFVSSAFDLESVEFLIRFNMPFWKIPSGEITNLPYLIKIAETRKPVIMSTGMATLEEISFAQEVLKQYGTQDLVLMHCTTEYPAPLEEVNLKAMETMRKHFDLPVGYSDHTRGIIVPIAAVARGACYIEKHFTLDKTMDGPDHKASLNPREFSEMVEAIRQVEMALGDGGKEPSPSELKNRNIARKSIVAKTSIQKGERFTTDNITTKRPGNGISPKQWFDVLGMVANRSFKPDELIEL
jgi:N,N'-diacetyllegionaminate synthase